MTKNEAKTASLTYSKLLKTSRIRDVKITYTPATSNQKTPTSSFTNQLNSQKHTVYCQT